VTWVAVAVAGAGLIGAGASYAGSKKQAGAAKSAGNQQMQMFDRLIAQQQPFIRSGYGAMDKLNTLLGLGGGGGGGSGGMPLGGNATLMPRAPYSQNTMYRPQPNGGIGTQVMAGQQSASPPQNIRLQQILALRAANGDTEAQRMLGGI
jgi:hypothetical protein